jgi:serine/threonine protein kinase
MSTTMPGGNNCRSCGAVIAVGDRFCPKCGAEATRIGADPAATLIVPPGDATIPSQGSLERITADRLTQATTGEFEILERIGFGAMGSVYLARDVALSRRVAIKVISPHLLEDESVIARFRLEAQTVAALRHPNIVNLHGVRQLGDLHYFIMDFIDGPSLRALMKLHAPLGIEVAQALLFQVGSALSYAHRRGRGVIHRDVKPANIMVDREGHAVVMDFGISKVARVQSGLTQTGATIGTPEYMSPEQCMDQELTGASDQYALGVVAYEMLTGAVPFKGSTYAVMMAHASSPPPPIRGSRPDCPPEVEEAVLRMLAKSPADRWPDLDAAVAALGGAPLGPSDPIRAQIVTLAESVSGDLTGLDDSSPLSPVPGAAEPASITILGLPDTVEPGDNFNLRVEPRASSGAELSSEDVIWSTSDPEVASIEEGTVLARRPGSVSLTATVGDVASTVLLTVRERRSDTVSVRPRAVIIEAGGTIRLQADILDRRGERLDGEVDWVSEDESIATVTADGSVTAVAFGTTTVTAKADDVKGSARIEVERATVHDLSIPDAPSAIHVGDEFLPVVVVTDSRGVELERSVSWRSDQRKIIAVREGSLVAVGTGTATITAECEGRSTSVELHVAPAEVASIIISNLPDRSHPGDRFTLQAQLLDRGRRPLIREVEWSSSDPDVASISGAGIVTVEAVGSTELTARSGEVVESVTLQATESSATDPIPVTSLASSSTSGREGRRWGPWIGLVATILISVGVVRVVARNGNPVTESVVTGSLEAGEDTARLTDSASATTADGLPASGGELPALGGGDEGETPTRPAESPAAEDVPAAASTREVDAAVEDRVAAPAVASVRIQGGDRVLQSGSYRTLIAVALDARNDTVRTPSVAWRSSDTRVATVRGGILSAVGQGDATIVATVSGVDGAIMVTVEGPPPMPPAREEAMRQVQRFIALLNRADAGAVERLLGGAAGRRQGAELLARMREANFAARLTRLGQPTLTERGAQIDFDVEMSWRGARGELTRRAVSLVAQLRSAPAGWRLAGVRRSGG